MPLPSANFMNTIMAVRLMNANEMDLLFILSDCLFIMKDVKVML